MAEQSTTSSQDSQEAGLPRLREKLLRDKAARRRYLAKAPVAVKLGILEEMRDTTSALKQTREQNRARLRAEIAGRAHA